MKECEGESGSRCSEVITSWLKVCVGGVISLCPVNRRETWQDGLLLNLFRALSVNLFVCPRERERMCVVVCVLFFFAFHKRYIFMIQLLHKLQIWFSVSLVELQSEGNRRRRRRRRQTRCG